MLVFKSAVRQGTVLSRRYQMTHGDEKKFEKVPDYLSCYNYRVAPNCAGEPGETRRYVY